MLGPLPAWGERPGDTAEGSQALWPPHWDISDESGDAAAGSSRALGPALPFSCPRSGSLRSGAAALVLPPPVGSERATGGIGLRFGGSQYVSGPAAAAACSLLPGRLSEPLVRPLVPRAEALDLGRGTFPSPVPWQ